MPPKDLIDEPPPDLVGNDTPESGMMENAFKTVDDLVRSLASGATFGYADEAAAAATTATGMGGQAGGGQTYEQNLAAEGARDKSISPYVSVPGEIAGAIGTAVAGGPAMAGGKALASLPGWLRATVLGGGYGALFGSGNAEPGLENRAKGAGLGGAAGAATGLAAYPLIKAGQAGVEALSNAIKGRTQPRVGALRKLGEAIGRDEMTPGRVRARLQNLGPQGTLADAGGENVLGLARATSGQPGIARNRALTTFNQRAESEGSRIAKVAAKSLSPDDFYAAEEGFVNALRTKAAPLYKSAYESNQSIMTPRLKRLLQSRHAQRALGETASIVEAERAAGTSKFLGAIDDELTQAARFARDVGKMDSVPREGVTKGFSLETWDQIKRGFDSLLESKTYRNEITQKLNHKGYAVDQMRRTLLGELDKATGGERSLYAQARKIYSGDAEVVGAIRDGRKAINLDPEIIRKQIVGLSESAQEAYRTGAARALKDIVDKTPDTASASRKLFGTSRNRARWREIFPDQKSFSDFARTMVSETQFNKTKNAVVGGSPTAPRIAEREDLLSNIAGVGGTLAGSNIPGTHALIGSSLGRKAAEAVFGPTGRMETELGKMLFNRNQPMNQRILDELVQKAQSGQLTQEQLSSLGRVMLMLTTQQEEKAIGQSQRP